MAEHIALRPMTNTDAEFLYQVYASTRAAELAVVDWDRAQKEDFLRMQFGAQHRHYQTHFPAAEYSIILVDGTPAGRLYLDRRKDEIRIVDIALLPAHRGQGLGTRMLTDILAEGRSLELPVRIHVEKFSPAVRLYNRLGFRQIGDTGVYDLMQWTPPEVAEVQGP